MGESQNGKQMLDKTSLSITRLYLYCPTVLGSGNATKMEYGANDGTPVQWSYLFAVSC